MRPNLGTKLNLYGLFDSFKLVAANNGVCPACNTELRIEALGNFSFLSEKTDLTDMFSKPEFPRTPQPPAGDLNFPARSFPKSLVAPFDFDFSSRKPFALTSLLELSNRLKLPRATARDRNGCYMKEEDGESEYSTKKVWTCDEWRH